MYARTYFMACFLAYIIGLVVTVCMHGPIPWCASWHTSLCAQPTQVTVMHVFRAAQPALLYLVPACLGSVTLLAVARREMPLLLAYKDTPEAEAAGVAVTDGDAKKLE
jgi:minor histocompatibility antigen H13